MPAALTLDQVKARAEAKQAAYQEAKGTAVSVDTPATITNTPEVKPERPNRNRSAFNGTDGKLKVNKPNLPGYHLHILNDYPGRIDEAVSKGYEFVSPGEVGGTSVNVVDHNTDIGDKVRFLVGRNEQGGPLYAYLMKIRQEWYDEDQAELQKRNDLIDTSIRKGQLSTGGTDGFYVPRGGITMKT